MTLKFTLGFIMSLMNAKHYKIGQLAKQFDISVETLRYYESEGLLLPEMRSASGYRLYGQQALETLNFINHAKRVGFSLKEIKQLLEFNLNKSQHTCEDIKQYTAIKEQEIDKKIEDYLKMKSALNKLYRSCCGGKESAVYCSILQALAAEDIDSDIDSGLDTKSGVEEKSGE